MAGEPGFDGSDPLDLEEQLTHEERFIQGRTREYAQDKLMTLGKVVA
jgi:hypothetical protein